MLSELITLFSLGIVCHVVSMLLTSWHVTVVIMEVGLLQSMYPGNLIWAQCNGTASVLQRICCDLLVCFEHFPQFSLLGTEYVLLTKWLDMYYELSSLESG